MSEITLVIYDVLTIPQYTKNVSLRKDIRTIYVINYQTCRTHINALNSAIEKVHLQTYNIDSPQRPMPKQQQIPWHQQYRPRQQTELSTPSPHGQA